jgi:hypothetical protein
LRIILFTLRRKKLCGGFVLMGALEVLESLGALKALGGLKIKKANG